jgi:hypothetical protein
MRCGAARACATRGVDGPGTSSQRIAALAFAAVALKWFTTGDHLVKSLGERFCGGRGSTWRCWWRRDRRLAAVTRAGAARGVGSPWEAQRPRSTRRNAKCLRACC